MTTTEPTDRMTTLPDGTALQVSDYGRERPGTPLVLVCGTTQSHRLWAPLLPALYAQHRVITYDHRGIGESTRGGGSISMASLADDLAALLDDPGLHRAHVLGWSLGSTVAQELALRHPSRVAALVLAGTWGRSDVFQTCVRHLHLQRNTAASTASVVKIDKDIPLKAAAVGCAVPTGWGSAVKSAGIEPGDTVIVMGIGGIGANALQGAAHAGAATVIAVDPVDRKREWAAQFGATHAFATIEQAADYARSITNGQGADATIVTIGVVKGEHVGQALASIRKAGTAVLTGLGDINAVGAPIALGELTLFQKRLQGSLFGASNPRRDIPNLLRMYQTGLLKLDELITSEYTLDQVAQAYEDMHAGRNLRGVVVFD